jgi:hypothetical protein
VRRAAPAGIAAKFGNHSFRATGITVYLRVRPESFGGISMTCSVAGDRYSWDAPNKAKQFQWQHPWWYPQVVEMTSNVSGQTLSHANCHA